jgi:glycosyltransferase involved in cell wall biosynthesis
MSQELATHQKWRILSMSMSNEWFLIIDLMALILVSLIILRYSLKSIRILRTQGLTGFFDKIFLFFLAKLSFIKIIKNYQDNFIIQRQNALAKAKKKEPWDIDFEQRLKKLENTSKKKAIYIYEKPDASTFRYRVYNVCQALEFSEYWTGTYFFENELPQLKNVVPYIDVVIFVRTQWSDIINTFFQQLKKHQIPTIFDIDDFVFDVENVPLILNYLGADLSEASYVHWFSYVSRFWLLAKMCDATSGTNEFLCEKLQKTFNKPSYVISNFLNHEQIKISEELYNKKINKAEGCTPFTIGYFSGSPSHKNDFKKIAGELKDLLNKYPEMRLEVVGYMEFPDFLEDLVKNKQIFLSPFVDFQTLQKKIAAVDVNIVPLVNNEFIHCKSELKFFEAALVGTITCATPSFSFKNSIDHAETSFLCEEGDWHTTIENIFKNNYSPTMITKAREYCLDRYSPQKQCPSIENVLASQLVRHCT